MAEERRRAVEEAQKAEVEAEKRQRLGRMRMRLHELWQMLVSEPTNSLFCFSSRLSPFFVDAQETDATERTRFLQECETQRNEFFTEDLFELYKTEVGRLTDQLPLVETITRREFIKFRLKEFMKSASDPQRLFQGDAQRLFREDAQRKELDVEMRRLNDILLKELPAYEKKHNCRFMYKGEYYLELMSSDVLEETRQVEQEFRVNKQQQPLNGTMVAMANGNSNGTMLTAASPASAAASTVQQVGTPSSSARRKKAASPASMNSR